MASLLAAEIIEQRIFLIRGEKVMIDRDLAALYNVPTKALNQAVRRNNDRFPSSFMFPLTKTESLELVTICDRFESLKHSSSPPLAFTEQGVAMLSSVLRSKRAIQVNIQIMSTFVHLRRMLADNRVLAQRLDGLEKRYDSQFKVVFDAMRKLIAPPDRPVRRKGVTYIIKKRME
jgi:hypothetical protein